MSATLIEVYELGQANLDCNQIIQQQCPVMDI